MNEFCLHPNVYATGPHRGLTSLLEDIWVRELTPGKGTIYIISGFANYNGGVRFYDVFRNHVKKGGKIVAIVSGSTAQNLSSKQVITELLDCGAEINIINRKRLLHAKCYGYEDTRQFLIVTSGNFTGPGMSQNAEASVLLDPDATNNIGFSWDQLVRNIKSQKWEIHTLIGKSLGNPAWGLLYNEVRTAPSAIVEDQEMSIIVTLGHADTARIQASKKHKANLGSQYFWLSRDCFDFFPPLTIHNKRGRKATYSAQITLNYIDLNIVDPHGRVTFEAENNFDFRLGTGKLRNTHKAKPNDLAVISRIHEAEYQLRIIRQGSSEFAQLRPFAINIIGHQGKRYGFISNKDLEHILGITL